jgi:hypothetical protein
MRAAAVLAAATLAALPGCGGGSEKPPALSGPQAQGLLTRVERIRASAAAGDLATTESRLRGFAREVRRLRASGVLDAARAQALLTGAARAAARARTEVVPPAPHPAPGPRGQEKKHDKEKKGKGKHKGHGEGD